MAIFEDTPFITSGNRDIDVAATIIWLGVICASVGNISWHVYRAIADLSTEKRSSRRRRNIQPWAIGLFVCLAIVALGVVNGLRFEHRKLRLASWSSIEEWRRDHSGVPVLGKTQKEVVLEAGLEFTEKLNHAVKPDLSNVHLPSVSNVKEAAGNAAEAVKDAAEAVTDTIKNAHIPTGKEVKKTANRGVRKAAEKAFGVMLARSNRLKETAEDTAGRITDFGQASSRWLFETVPIPNEHAYSFPWPPMGPKKETSLWDFFKTLVDEGRHFWWTQQWMTAYLAWSVYVGIEGRNRSLPAWPFIVLSYCFSLAASQSLYFALMLLKPNPRRQRHQQSWMPYASVVAFPIVLEMFGLAYLRTAYWKIVEDKSTLFMSAPVFFNVLQAFLIALPMYIAFTICDYLPLSWGTRRASFADAKKDLRVFWWVVSMAIYTLHIVSTISVFREAWDMLPRWSSWLAHWGVPGLKNSDPTESGFSTVLFILGSHDWLSAVGWDVVLSTLSLCAWAIVSAADVRGMLKCGLWPWFDESLEALQDGAELLQETAEPYLEAMQENVERLHQQAEPYAKDLRKRTRRAMKSVEPYLETARDYVDDGLGEGAEYAKHAFTSFSATEAEELQDQVSGRCELEGFFGR
ncbi:hypothetical protein LTR08_000104 [Meristemomyces frigidus]|nr:hypothetical protein LTR08_000104 [Meristemomyces frigidus]